MMGLIMSAADNLGLHLDNLSAQDRQQLDSWLQAFGQGWDERRWARAIGKLPEGPLRRPAMIEMAKIDLARRWQKGERVGLDFYLKISPDLATDGAPPPDLLAAEQQAREQFGNQAAAAQEPAVAVERFRPISPAPIPPPPPPTTAPARAVRPDVAARIAVIPATLPVFMTAPAERLPRSPRTPDVVFRPAESQRPPRRGTWLWVGGGVLVAGLAVAAFAWFRVQPATTEATPATAEITPVAPLRLDDPVRTVSVKISVGGGSDLTEQIGLDLGLGFPLWLDPIGSDPTRPAPFGAMPQTGPASRVLKAGSEATFTFAAAGDPGRDVLRTSQQLLAGVLAGDIRRVAFIGPVTTEWELAAYEVKVNGRMVAAGTPNVCPRKLLDKTATRPIELGMNVSTLQHLRADFALREARMGGKTPWFVASVTDLPVVPAGKPIRSVRATVFTRAHEAAGTRNYVYLTFGAAKYLMGSPATPLAPGSPRQLDLDLDAAPLSDMDIRGCSMGMLAHSEPQGDTPDRWHPQRLVVEINEALAFDSDKADRNRRSLNAVRLVPPAQIDWTGKPHDIHPCPREVSVWAFNSGAGLNIADQPLPLSDGDGAAPQAEPGTIEPGQPTPNPVFTEGADNFPGEVPIVIAPPPEPSVPPVSAVTDPRPAARALQLLNVRIADGLRVDDPFTVRWDVTGDETGVDHYEVLLVRIRPEKGRPSTSGSPNGTEYMLNDHVPKPVRSITGMPADLADSIFDPIFTVRPLVRAVPATAGHKQLLQQLGPARAVFPRAPLRPQLTLKPLFWKGRLDGAPVIPPAAAAPPNVLSVRRPATPATAVWQAGQIECNGTIYSGEGPTPNLAVRLENPAEELRLWLRSGVLPPTNRRRDLTAFVGFEDESPGQIDVRMNWYATPPGSADAKNGAWQTIAAPGVLPMRMALPPETGPTVVTVWFDFRKSTGGPTSRPTLFGVRLVERP